MTAAEYISGKFSSFNVNLTEADLLDMSAASGLDMGAEIDVDTVNLANIAMTALIPSLITMGSVNESGFSVSFNKEGLLQYYNYLCKRYGLENALDDDRPRVTFL